MVSGKPLLGMPLRQAGAPLDPSYKTPFMLAQAAPAPRKDPLVLDLDGDGIETLGQQAVTYFDHDGNGFAELTGWVQGDDGFLVFDRNGDGASTTAARCSATTPCWRAARWRRTACRPLPSGTWPPMAATATA
jgi:hypothetical protein